MEVLYIKALSPVLLKLKLSTRDILQGPLEYTDLPWHTPPLVSDAKLGDVPLQGLLDCAVRVNEESLYALWYGTMTNLMNMPNQVLGAYGYRGLHFALDAPHGERAIRLSRPQGFPGKIDEYAGAVLSLEVAHTCKLAGLAVAFHEGDSDYWVQTKSGYEIGVRNGLPIVGGDQWDTSFEGFVPELLRRPRGDAFYGCDYDLIARLRSFLHTYRSRIPEDFEAADWLLQALRVLAYGRHLPRLLSAVRRLGEVREEGGTRLEDLKSCMEIMQAGNLSDRQKISALKGLLVPNHLGKTAFSRRVYPYHAGVPAVLRPLAAGRVRGNIEDLYRIEEALYAE